MQSNILKIMFEQKDIYDQIMQTINNGAEKIFVLDAPGAAGKPLRRDQNNIAVALAQLQHCYQVEELLIPF
ncbi:unnamed protein product [Onchocerca flexuosa]|uniref:Transposase n=1 Tax=Onchocerca flexuosa TaxID=387005 RepID=A0A183HEG4_9BILA|nr:unnamed protein product [Onchocerca flexuosa]